MDTPDLDTTYVNIFMMCQIKSITLVLAACLVGDCQGELKKGSCVAPMRDKRLNH
jgi:hypothetical protein